MIAPGEVEAIDEYRAVLFEVESLRDRVTAAREALEDVSRRHEESKGKALAARARLEGILLGKGGR